MTSNERSRGRIQGEDKIVDGSKRRALNICGKGLRRKPSLKAHFDEKSVLNGPHIARGRKNRAQDGDKADPSDNGLSLKRPEVILPGLAKNVSGHSGEKPDPFPLRGSGPTPMNSATARR